MAQVAERVPRSPLTIIRIEKGCLLFKSAYYARVLYALQLDDDLLLIVKEDVLGRTLQDLSLKHRQRASKKTDERVRTDPSSLELCWEKRKKTKPINLCKHYLYMPISAVSTYFN